MAWKENLSELKKGEGRELFAFVLCYGRGIHQWKIVRKDLSLSLSLSALSFGPLADAVSPQGISIKGPEREGRDARSEQERSIPSQEAAFLHQT